MLLIKVKQGTDLIFTLKCTLVEKNKPYYSCGKEKTCIDNYVIIEFTSSE